MNYYNVIFLCIILIILLYFFITKNLGNYKPDYILIIITILILSITFIQIQKKILENFEAIDNKVQLETKDEDINYIDYENIKLLGNKLVIYLSSYSKKSYNEGITWNNLANNEIVPNTFYFTKEPILTSLREIKMQANSIKGPFSMDLGIDMSKDFTVFLNIKLTQFTDTDKLLKLFELYATKDNIGLYASIIQDDNKEFFIKISSAFSNEIYYKLSNIQLSLFDNRYHLITIVKNSEFIKLYIDDNLDNSNNLPISTEILTFDNKFSNATTNILNNSNNKIIYYITHFGIYNKALTINNAIHEVKTLYDYIQNINFKQNDIYSKLVTEFNNLKKDIDLSKENPFNSQTINKKCSMITDWSNFDNIIVNADDNCLKSINDYCQTDQNFEQCKIWNSFQKLVPYFTEKKSLDLIDLSFNNTYSNSNNKIDIDNIDTSYNKTDIDTSYNKTDIDTSYNKTDIKNSDSNKNYSLSNISNIFKIDLKPIKYEN